MCDHMIPLPHQYIGDCRDKYEAESYSRDEYLEAFKPNPMNYWKDLYRIQFQYATEVIDGHFIMIQKYKTQLSFKQELKLILPFHYHKTYFKQHILSNLIAEALHPRRMILKLDNLEDMESFFDNL